MHIQDSHLDQRDAAIVADRQASLDRNAGPRVGDYVEFADGVVRRISHIWESYQDPEPQYSFPALAQTSAGGSYYLGNGYVSFSGSLYRGVRLDTLTATGEVRPGPVWIFHHDWRTAHNGVDTSARFRVYRSTEPAPN